MQIIPLLHPHLQELRAAHISWICFYCREPNIGFGLNMKKTEVEDNCARKFGNLLTICCFVIVTRFQTSRFAQTGNCVFCEQRVFHQCSYLISFGKMDPGSVSFGVGKGLVWLHFKAFGGKKVWNLSSTNILSHSEDQTTNKCIWIWHSLSSCPCLHEQMGGGVCAVAASRGAAFPCNSI